MKIKVDSDYIIVDGVKYVRGCVLEYELSKDAKAMLVLNGQAVYDFSDNAPKEKENTSDQ